MFEKVFSVIFLIVWGSLSQPAPLQATIPDLEWDRGYDEAMLQMRDQAEATSHAEETGFFSMIEDDDALALWAQNLLLREVMEKSGMVDDHSFENNLIDTLDAVNTSGVISKNGLFRLSVQRKILIKLLDLGDENFRALSNEAKNGYLVDELMELLKDNLDYQSHFKRRMIDLQKKIKNNIFSFAKKSKDISQQIINACISRFMTFSSVIESHRVQESVICGVLFMLALPPIVEVITSP